MQPGSAIELLHPKVREALGRLGYERLLPIQERAIPVVMGGADALIVSPTGSGKTEAALLPILSMMAKLRDEGRLERGVKAVYVTPLRALNRDIEYRMRRLVEELGFTIQVRHGDTGSSGRRRFLRSPPDLMVTTPESLTLLLSATASRGIWDNVGWVIVDEIQELVDNERGAELSVTLERLERISKRRIQRIGLSATLSEHTMKEAASVLAGPRRVSYVVDMSGKRYDVGVEVVGEGLDWDRLVRRVADLISASEGQVLVFVNTRSTAEKLASDLSRILGREVVGVHHGSLARTVREEAERLFKEGKIKAIVATSSMELGIDVGAVDLVIQFMSPRQVLAMTQRGGRAGHRVGETSRAVIVVPGNLFEVLESAVIAFRTMKGHLEDYRAPRGLTCPLAHQMVAVTVERGSLRLQEFKELVGATVQYADASLDQLEEIAAHLDSLRILRYDESTGTLREGRRSRKYLYGVSMIPDEATYIVVDMIEDKKIGEVSERFVEASLMELREGERLRFVLSGKLWEAVEIDYESSRIIVRPVAEASGLIPVWRGELIPVDYKVAREVCALLSLAMDDPPTALKLLQARRLGRVEAERVIEAARRSAAIWGAPLLEPRRPVIEEYPTLTVIYVCLGSRGNMALALLISELLEGKGVAASFSHIPYAIVLRTPDNRGVPGDLAAQVLKEASQLDPTLRAGLVYKALKRSQAFLYRFLHVARRLGVIDPDAKPSPSILRKLREAYEGSVVERETLKELVHDKLDMRALNEFLDSMKEPAVIKLGEATPLALAVLENPYMKRDVAVELREIAIGKLIEGVKRRLQSKRALLLCTRCGHTWSLEVGGIPERAPLRCPRCGYPTIAVLPPGEWGERLVDVYRRKLRGERLSREEEKLAREVEERAGLYMHYAFQGLGRRVAEALLARGVGPAAAKRALEKLMIGGEREFYRAIMEAEENYFSTRIYWEKGENRR